jgi:hypothetical protein
MGKAYKCDRCEELFGDYQGYVKFGFSKTHTDQDKKQDLCFDCQKSLRTWWKNNEIDI